MGLVNLMRSQENSSQETEVTPIKKSNQYLTLDSTLEELSLSDCYLETHCLGQELAAIFQKSPLLPGVILKEDGKFAGLISRQQFLEYLLLPRGWEFFLSQNLQTLYNYIRPEILILSGKTTILTGVKKALRRTKNRDNEPVVVQLESDNYQILDFGQLNIAAWQIRGLETQVRYERTQAKILQSEKMASLGRLVDGIAHEILDPVSFIWGNLAHVSAYSKSLLELLNAYEKLIPEEPEVITQLKEDLEFDFLQEDLPQAVTSITSGAQRLKNLASSLQNFCHIDNVYPKPANLHSCLDGIILLLKSHLSSDIEITTHYTSLPPVACYVGHLSQVFMNILTNAVDALLSQAVSQQINTEWNHSSTETLSVKPQIEVTTQIKEIAQKRWVAITIADNGPGISFEYQQQIRESWSLNGRVYKETSLAMSYQIVTAKHGGKLDMRSRPNFGTEFEILLPLV